MPEIKLEDINLNLLVSLDALLTEKNVTKAARRLGVTQSAMSHSLRRLRDMFNDQLLVSSSSGMVLTPRAERLAAPLHEELVDLQRVLSDEQRFCPECARRQFRIATTDFTGMVIIPPLLSHIQANAPGVDLIFRPLDFDRTPWMLETGELAMSIGFGFDSVTGLRRKKLFEDGFSTLVCQNHPMIQSELTLEQFVQAPHALISPTAEGVGVVDRVLEEMGHKRRVALKVPFFAAAPWLISGSEMILTAPSRLAHTLAESFALRVFEPPVDLPTFSIVATWHERFDQDPAHTWLRQALELACADL